MPMQAPQWTEFLSCPICCNEFDLRHRPPISLGCCHTICNSCLATLHRKQCPFDQTLIRSDIDQLPINYAMLSLATGYSAEHLRNHHRRTARLEAPGAPTSASTAVAPSSLCSSTASSVASSPASSAAGSPSNSGTAAQPISEQPGFQHARAALESLSAYLYTLAPANVQTFMAANCNANNGAATIAGSKHTSLSRPLLRKLVMLINCQLVEEEGRGRAMRSARSIGERAVTEMILLHQNPQQLSANLWAAVRARGCQFLGPGMQEEVLKLVLLALEDGSALSRKVLVMFVVQRLEPHFSQASKTSIGHVVQLLYRASCFKVSKRDGDSSLMQLKEEFRTYDTLRREHDAQIVQIATEAGLRIAPDQWSSLLYGDTYHKSHMQSIIDKLQTPQSFGQSVQELMIAIQRTNDASRFAGLRVHFKRLTSIEAGNADGSAGAASPDGSTGEPPVPPPPTAVALPAAACATPDWRELTAALEAVRQVLDGLVLFMVRHGNRKNQEPMQMHNPRFKVSMCRDLAIRSTCPRGLSCTFAHSEEELDKYRAKNRKLICRTPPVQQPSGQLTADGEPPSDDDDDATNGEPDADEAPTAAAQKSRPPKTPQAKLASPHSPPSAGKTGTFFASRRSDYVGPPAAFDAYRSHHMQPPRNKPAAANGNHAPANSLMKPPTGNSGVSPLATSPAAQMMRSPSMPRVPPSAGNGGQHQQPAHPNNGHHHHALLGDRAASVGKAPTPAYAMLNGNGLGSKAFAPNSGSHGLLADDWHTNGASNNGKFMHGSTGSGLIGQLPMHQQLQQQQMHHMQRQTAFQQQQQLHSTMLNSNAHHKSADHLHLLGAGPSTGSTLHAPAMHGHHSPMPGGKLAPHSKLAGDLSLRKSMMPVAQPPQPFDAAGPGDALLRDIRQQAFKSVAMHPEQQQFVDQLNGSPLPSAGEQLLLRKSLHMQQQHIQQQQQQQFLDRMAALSTRNAPNSAAGANNGPYAPPFAGHPKFGGQRGLGLGQQAPPPPPPPPPAAQSPFAGYWNAAALPASATHSANSPTAQHFAPSANNGNGLSPYGPNGTLLHSRPLRSAAISPYGGQPDASNAAARAESFVRSDSILDDDYVPFEVPTTSSRFGPISRQPQHLAGSLLQQLDNASDYDGSYHQLLKNYQQQLQQQQHADQLFALSTGLNQLPPALGDAPPPADPTAGVRRSLLLGSDGLDAATPAAGRFNGSALTFDLFDASGGSLLDLSGVQTMPTTSSPKFNVTDTSSSDAGSSSWLNASGSAGNASSLFANLVTDDGRQASGSPLHWQRAGHALNALLGDALAASPAGAGGSSVNSTPSSLASSSSRSPLNAARPATTQRDHHLLYDASSGIDSGMRELELRLNSDLEEHEKQWDDATASGGAPTLLTPLQQLLQTSAVRH